MNDSCTKERLPHEAYPKATLYASVNKMVSAAMHCGTSSRAICRRSSISVEQVAKFVDALQLLKLHGQSDAQRIGMQMLKPLTTLTN